MFFFLLSKLTLNIYRRKRKDSQHGVGKETKITAEKVNLVDLTELRDTQEIHRAHFWVYLSGHFQKLACGTASQRDLP